MKNILAVQLLLCSMPLTIISQSTVSNCRNCLSDCNSGPLKKQDRNVLLMNRNNGGLVQYSELYGMNTENGDEIQFFVHLMYTSFDLKI